ncbi:MAG: ABC transporter permease, partial [Desulfobacterales bacterium]|nr:ABC transporter permease [Desulfobacterales bacterium]
MKTKKNSLWGQVFVRLKKNRMALIGLAILVGLVILALFADFIAPFPFDEQDLFATLEGPSRAHWFGTDEFGRDIFSRIIYGSRISLQVGFVAVGFSVVAGGFLGAVAGYYGGRTDNIVMRCMDVLLSIPQLLLAISVAASLGPGLFNLMLAVGIAAIPQYARLVRAS